MQTILVDIGNSKVVAALWPEAASELVPRSQWLAADSEPAGLERLFVVPRPRTDDQIDALESVCCGIIDQYMETPLVLSSVVPRFNSYFTADFTRVKVVDHMTEFPFTVGIEEPAAVGADRYCNVTAAVTAGWQSALIVDAGTATTFDLLIDGKFIGGLIAPGMAFAAEKLGEAAARLDPVPFADCPLEAGPDTASAMQRGAYHVGVNGINGTIDGLLAGYGDIPVVLTGGLGFFLKHPGRLYDPDWTLRGAAALL